MKAISRKAGVVLGSLVSIAIIAGAALLAHRSHRIAGANPLSDDVTLQADVAQIALSVPGRITAIHVRGNDFVHKGDLLVELDDTPYRLALAQAQADLEIATAASSDQARNIRAERANMAIAEEQVNRAEANLELATQTLDRLLPMQSKGYVSAQQIDDARTLKRDAEVSLNEALRQIEAAEALIGDEEGTEALIRARQVAVAIAEHELANTRIHAPFDGRVVGFSAAIGDYVVPAQSIFSLIDINKWYASANYPETVLGAIKVGDCASVYALSDRKRLIRGTVEGIGWGIATKDLVQLPTSLPIVPKSLDWVRVQQRFPVEIRLEDPPADLMRVGASAVAIVHHEDGC